MPLLHQNTPNTDILSGRNVTREVDQSAVPLENAVSNTCYPGFADPVMFAPHLFSQFMAASGLALQTNPAFFHALNPLAWPANPPPSGISPQEQLAALQARQINNNNVSSTNIDISKKWKTEDDTSTPSPRSSASPQSSTTDVCTKDVTRDKQFTCGVCNRSFGYKHVLQNHERTHTGEKPFKCIECDKRFTRDHHLKTHMRLHTGERPYHCEHCDKQFVQVANLRRHLRVHTGERPYSCKHCSAKFSDSNQLKAHLLIHTDEKPFDCDKCHARFRRRHHLVTHKCGMQKRETTPGSEDKEDIRRRRMVQNYNAPLITKVALHLPEQTEPEDLSVKSGNHSHNSSGGSPMSRSPSSRDDLDSEEYESQVSTPIFVQRRPSLH